MLLLSPDDPLDSQQLGQRYKELALLIHPDKNPSSSRAQAEAAFKCLSGAYEKLSGPPSIDAGSGKQGASSTADAQGAGKRRKGNGAGKRVLVSGDNDKRRSWCDLSFDEVAAEIDRLESQVVSSKPDSVSVFQLLASCSCVLVFKYCALATHPVLCIAHRRVMGLTTRQQ